MTAGLRRSRSAYGQVNKVFVQHPRFTRPFEEICQAIMLSGEGLEAPCMRLTGPSGIGKSTLKQKLGEAFPRKRNARTIHLPRSPPLQADHIPLLQLEMPTKPTAKSLGREFLLQLGDEDWFRGDEFRVTDRVDRFLSGCGTGGIVIDEVNRAVDRAGVVVADGLTEWLIQRHARNPVALILLGQGRMNYLFAACGQMERRWDADLRMEPYAWFSVDGSEATEDQDTFIGILAAFRDLSPLPYNFNVEDDDVAYRFYYCCRGAIGLLKKLLKQAMRIAEQVQAAALDMRLLEEAFTRAFPRDSPRLQNPFSTNFEPWRRDPPPPLPDDRLLLPSPAARRRSKQRRIRDDELKARLTK